jgi:hypothetical protein
MATERARRLNRHHEGLETETVMRAEETEETTGHADQLVKIKTIADFNNVHPPHKINGNHFTLPQRATTATILTELHDVIIYARGLELTNKQLNAGNVKLKEENAALNEALQATMVKSEKEKSEIHLTCKRKVFMKHKFIPNEDDEQQAALLCYRHICEDNNVDPLADKAKMNAWVVRWKEDVTSGIANERGYIQQRMWASLRLFVVAKGFVPKLNEILACAKRDFDIENERQVTIMEWYWTDLMGTFCADCS